MGPWRVLFAAVSYRPYQAWSCSQLGFAPSKTYDVSSIAVPSHRGFEVRYTYALCLQCVSEGTNPVQAPSQDVHGYSQIVSRVERTAACSRRSCRRVNKYIYIDRNDLIKKSKLPYRVGNILQWLSHQRSATKSTQSPLRKSCGI